MERKRIVIETGDDIANGEEYQALQEKLKGIEKKLTAPWVMPVILATFGALLTGTNFYFQQEYNSAKLYHNKVREKVAELRATIAVNFYGNSIRALDSLDAALQSYCELGPSTDDETVIQNQLIRLNALARQQYYVDTTAANSIHRYTQFIAIDVYKLNPMPKPDVMSDLYQKSNTLYKIAYDKLNEGIERITK